MDLEYEIEFVCFIGRRFNLKPYIKDIRIDSVLFHHFTWTKAYATTHVRKLNQQRLSQ